MPTDSGYTPPRLQLITHREADALSDFESAARELRSALETFERAVRHRCKRDGLHYEEFNHVAMARQHVAISVGLLVSARGGETVEVDGGTQTMAERIRGDLAKAADAARRGGK